MGFRRSVEVVGIRRRRLRDVLVNPSRKLSPLISSCEALRNRVGEQWIVVKEKQPTLSANIINPQSVLPLSTRPTH